MVHPTLYWFGVALCTEPSSYILICYNYWSTFWSSLKRHIATGINSAERFHFVVGALLCKLREHSSIWAFGYTAAYSLCNHKQHVYNGLITGWHYFMWMFDKHSETCANTIDRQRPTNAPVEHHAVAVWHCLLHVQLRPHVPPKCARTFG